jgi:tetratricopeptide (TPR) repeat protein
LTDLNPAIELYHHLVRAGLYDRAWVMYAAKLRRPLYYQFGLYLEDLQLLTAIPQTQNGLPQLTLPSHQSWNLIYAGMCYERTGKPILGLQIIDKAIKLSRQIKDWNSLASALVPYSMLCCDVGNLRIAKDLIQESLSINEIKGSINWQGISHRSYGRVLTISGHFEEAIEEFDTALTIYGEVPDEFVHGLSVLWTYWSYLYLLQNEPYQAMEAAQKAKELSGSGKLERERIKATWLMGEANVLAFIATNEHQFLKEAELHLRDVLISCRNIGLLELEPNILLNWARWYFLNENIDASRKSANEALTIAERCDYRLKQADIHNFLAQLALAEGDKARAREHAQKGYDYAWCDGPPYSYAVAVAEAERLLKECGGF